MYSMGLHSSSTVVLAPLSFCPLPSGLGHLQAFLAKMLQYRTCASVKVSKVEGHAFADVFGREEEE